MLNKKYRIFIIFYFIVVIYFINFTLKEHKKQNTIEHFNVSMMKRKEKRQKNADCKAKCEVKYENKEDIKVCKSYCKCKKKCNGNKKCIKNCKSIKMNIYRDDKQKIKRMEIKDKIRNIMKDERKEKKKEQKRKIIEYERNQVKTEVEKVSFVDNVIDKYFSEDDKNNLIGTHNSMNGFYKDLKSVFRMKNN
jgi:hypothetical protein